MRKTLGIIVGILLLLPTIVFAADFTVNLSCPYKLEKENEFICTVSTTDPSVTAFQVTIDLTLAPNLQLNGTKVTESFIGKTGNISLKSTSNATGVQKIKLTEIKDSNMRIADDVQTDVIIESTEANQKDNPKTSIDGALVLILVIASAGIIGYYLFNRSSKFISI